MIAFEQAGEPQEPFEPPPDLIFQHLLEEAVRGNVPVFGIVIQASRLTAFDPSHRPELTVSGRRILELLLERWRGGSPPQPWVYPKGEQFVVSDDYFALATVRAAGADTVACQCLGNPSEAHIESITKPLSVDWIKRALGLPHQ